eukprot:3107954-Pyramimonas_sp.AAC.1
MVPRRNLWLVSPRALMTLIRQLQDKAAGNAEQGNGLVTQLGQFIDKASVKDITGAMCYLRRVKRMRLLDRGAATTEANIPDLIDVVSN